jgi:hypothetical protein
MDYKVIKSFNPGIEIITIGVGKVPEIVTSYLDCHCKRQGWGGAFDKSNLI